MWVTLPIGWSRVVDKDLAVGRAGEVVVSALVTSVIEEASAQAIEILKILAVGGRGHRPAASVWPFGQQEQGHGDDGRALSVL